MSVSKTALSPAILQKPQVSTPTAAYVVLVVIVILDTFSTSLIRLTLNSGMPPLAIAGLRMMLSWLIFTPVILWKYKRDLRRMSWLDVLLMAAAGCGFAGHIILAFMAVDNTSILTAGVIFATLMLWVAAMETALLKARLHRLVLIGLVLVFAGSVVISIGSSRQDNHDDSVQEPTSPDEKTPDKTLLGIALALGSSVAGATYMVIGRKARERLAAAPYMWGVYSGGAVTSLTIIAMTRTPITGYSAEAYFWMLTLLLLAQFAIHGGLGYIVGHISATFISISAQTVVVTSAIAAYFLFAEVPQPLEIAGSVVIMSGVILAILGQRKKRAYQPELSVIGDGVPDPGVVTTAGPIPPR